MRRWSHMNHAPACHHAHATAPKCPGIVHQSGHQHAVRFQEISLSFGHPPRHALVGRDGITRLQYFAWRGNHSFAFQDCRDLPFTQGVTLNGQ